MKKFLFLLIILLLIFNLFSEKVSAQSTVQVFVLVGQSNMKGFGKIYEFPRTSSSLFDVIESSFVDTNSSFNRSNTLIDVMQKDAIDQWSMIESNGTWSVMDNAYLYFERETDTIINHITVGQGASHEYFGPELMFAYQMDQYYQEPVLIIKIAFGGVSLAKGFRPPSSGGITGPYYTKMIETVKEVTSNIPTEFISLGFSDFELAGFSWFQGWNDGISNDVLNQYESNLYHLVNDVRKDLGSLNLPIVIASAGQGGYGDHRGTIQDMQDIISVAQENVGCNDAIYGGTLGFVNTKPFYMPVSESPEKAEHHYNNNALSFLNIGKSIGDEMILAINDLAYCSNKSIIEFANKKELIKITDIFGRDVNYRKNIPLFFIYSDGSVEKKLIIE